MGSRPWTGSAKCWGWDRPPEVDGIPRQGLSSRRVQISQSILGWQEMQIASQHCLRNVWCHSRAGGNPFCELQPFKIMDPHLRGDDFQARRRLVLRCSCRDRHVTRPMPVFVLKKGDHPAGQSPFSFTLSRNLNYTRSWPRRRTCLQAPCADGRLPRSWGRVSADRRSCRHS